MTPSIYELLKLAPKFNGRSRSLPFAEADIPEAVLTELAEQISVMQDRNNDSFGPWGKQLARWADLSVPVVEAAIAKGVVVEAAPVEEVVVPVETPAVVEEPVADAPVIEEPAAVEEPVVEVPAEPVKTRRVKK